jgi:hypothetical protein
MTNLIDTRYHKLYCGVTRVNLVRFQEGTDRYLTINFNYNGGDTSFEVYVKEGISDSNKAPFLIEVHTLLDSMINHGDYITTEQVKEKINNIEISDWARDFI